MLDMKTLSFQLHVAVDKYAASGGFKTTNISYTKEK